MVSYSPHTRSTKAHLEISLPTVTPFQQTRGATVKRTVGQWLIFSLQNQYTDYIILGQLGKCYPYFFDCKTSEHIYGGVCIVRYSTKFNSYRKVFLCYMLKVYVLVGEMDIYTGHYMYLHPPSPSPSQSPSTAESMYSSLSA